MSIVPARRLLAAAVLSALSLPLSAAPAPEPAPEPDPGPRPRRLESVEVRAQRLRKDYHYNVDEIRSATKTDSNIVDVPQSISVVTQALIRDQAMQGVGDALRYIPGVGVAQGEGNRDAPIFRGNQTTSDLFVDGVRDDAQYYRDLYNIERVEILKGPNAMIFGRGAAGGLVNRVGKVADWSDPRQVELQVGSWNNVRLTGDFGASPNESVSIRGTAVYQDTESYRDFFEAERKGVNPTVSFRPGDATVVTLGYERFEEDRVADRGIPSFNGRPIDVDASQFFGNPAASPAWTDVDAFNAVVEHQFEGGVLLTNRTRWAQYDKFYQNVFPGAVTVVNGERRVAISGYNNATDRENLFNQTDLNLQFATGPLLHTLLVGTEFGRQDTANLRQTAYFPTLGTNTTTHVVPVSDPISTIPVTFRPSATDADNESTADIASFYVQDQVELSPMWQIVAGARFDRFEVDLDNNRNGQRFASDDDLVSPRAGVIFQPSDALSFYASYSEAFLPRAGDQLSSLSASNASLDPEEFQNREVGMKWSFRPDLVATAAVYRLDRNNVAVTNPTNPNETFLVDGQRVDGVELELSGNITDQWRMLAGYAYQDSELLVTTGANAQAGAELAQVPRHALSLWNRYDFNDRLGVGLGVIHRDDSFTSTDNTVVLPSYTRVDAAVFYAVNANLSLQLNVENLLDREYYPNAHSNNNITPGAPLNAKLGLTYRF